jgi:hypothetical protein
MMTIKDISASTELDSKAMTGVRGGNAAILSTNVQKSSQNGLGGLVNVNDSSQGLFSLNSTKDSDLRYIEIQKVGAGYGNFVL